MIKSLYVGNLPYSANEKDVFDFFAEFEPKAVRIVEGRGFGFVDVPQERVAACIETLHGKEFNGRKLVVNEARQKPREGQGNN